MKSDLKEEDWEGVVLWEPREGSFKKEVINCQSLRDGVR